MISTGQHLFDFLAFSLTLTDLLGIVFAITSSIFLALFMLTVRHSIHQNFSSEQIFRIQLFSLAIASSILSLLFQEDWGKWLELRWTDWIVFGLFSLGVFGVASISNIAALRNLGASFVSSLLGWRLITTVVLGSLMLEESLNTIWQILGAIIVGLTITLYVYSTYTQSETTNIVKG
jgi:drug/metabolite transporter (DMT)-like permease